MPTERLYLSMKEEMKVISIRRFKPTDAQGTASVIERTLFVSSSHDYSEEFFWENIRILCGFIDLFVMLWYNFLKKSQRRNMYEF